MFYQDNLLIRFYCPLDFSFNDYFKPTLTVQESEEIANAMPNDIFDVKADLISAFLITAEFASKVLNAPK